MKQKSIKLKDLGENKPY